MFLHVAKNIFLETLIARFALARSARSFRWDSPAVLCATRVRDVHVDVLLLLTTHMCLVQFQYNSRRKAATLLCPCGRILEIQKVLAIRVFHLALSSLFSSDCLALILLSEEL